MRKQLSCKDIVLQSSVGSTTFRLSGLHQVVRSIVLHRLMNGEAHMLFI